MPPRRPSKKPPCVSCVPLISGAIPRVGVPCVVCTWGENRDLLGR